MKFSLASARRAFLGISPDEASFARRSFPAASPAKQAHLERIGHTFIDGYLAALDTRDLVALLFQLNATPEEFRGFAFEGAGMALALTDHLWRRRAPRFDQFLHGPAGAHRYMLYIGYGWAAARLPWVRRKIQLLAHRFDPYLGSLMIDGYGFHEGFFHPQSTISRMQRPGSLPGNAARIFDQGLGRALWFFNGADAGKVSVCVNRFPSSRRPDLWSGVGLAATYAGGVTEAELMELLGRAAPYRGHVAQGAAFAAKARHFAGIPTPHTEAACRIFCGMPSAQAALVTDSALAAAKCLNCAEPYEAWRAEIRAEFENGRSFAAQSI
ncbi:MAG: DUF1702 family protein [Acidobacteriaceae bacterium]|nr:DUF1702 family protein [Acidobacteriaceae bacterium]